MCAMETLMWDNEMINYGECQLPSQSDFRLKNLLRNFFKFSILQTAGWWFTANRDCYHNVICMFGVPGGLLHLWGWRTRYQTIWIIWQRIWTLQMVCAIDGNATNLFDIPTGHTAANQYRMLWRHSMHTQYIQKCNLLLNCNRKTLAISQLSFSISDN